MNKDIYYGYIIKGDLIGAIGYIKQFPDQSDLYNRFMDIFDYERYINYEIDAALNNILTVYQQYYRDVFYLCMEKEQAENRLRDRLKKMLDIPNVEIDMCDLEQKQLVDLFQRQGLHFMGGKTSGYFGPYVWKSSETVSYDVELPDGIQTYTVKLLDGFISRSWIDYLSFSEIGPGGWTDSDGYINCVKSAWAYESESFQISLLKHEAQHAKDLEMNKNLSSEDLEYRAKLVELIYSKERNLLEQFVHEASNSDMSNGHAVAAFRIVRDFLDILGVDENTLATCKIVHIQSIARTLFFKDSFERYHS